VWLIEQYLTTEVNPVEKKTTATRRTILTEICGLEDIIVILLNVLIYFFVPSITNDTKELMLISREKRGNNIRINFILNMVETNSTLLDTR
jgi:hypothetical protein